MLSHCFLASMVSDKRMSHIFLVAFKICSLFFFFFFLTFWLSCVYGWISEFILHGVTWASWICRLKFFIKFLKFQCIISSNILSAHFFLSSPPGTPMICILMSQLSLKQLIFLIFFPFCFSDWIISINLFSGSMFFLLPAKICCWNL